MSDEKGTFAVKQNAAHEREYATGGTSVTLFSGKIPNGSRRRMVHKYKYVYKLSGRSLNGGVFTKYTADIDVRNGEKVKDIITCIEGLGTPDNITPIDSYKWGIEFIGMGTPESYEEIKSDNGDIVRLFYRDVTEGSGVGLMMLSNGMIFFRFNNEGDE